MKYRKLRIAWSVAWGVLCLLLIALWVRSYFGMDRVRVPLLGVQTLSYYSFQGKLLFNVYPGDPRRSFSWVDTDYRHSFEANVRAWSWVVPKSGGPGALLMPYWLPGFVFAALAAAPWMRWRFSLRALLIGMTLIALGLGWIMYATRN